VSDNIHRQKENNPDRQLRPLISAKFERKLGCCDIQDVGLEAAVIYRVRNSSLDEELSADNDRE
jgi:hypothetical protein